MRFYRTLFLFILTFILLANSLFAQDNKKDLFELSLEDLMNVEITTATKRSQKISEAPATVVSFTADQIETYGWRDLKDIFRNITGVDVSYDVQGEVKTLVTFRGVEGNQKILILQDGQRQNPITGERFIFGHNIPLNIYKRVEIVFGPASALYGADAYAGVVNLITKDGGEIDGLSGSAGYVSTNAIVSSLSFGKSIDDETDVLIYGRIYNGRDFPYHKYYKSLVDYAAVNQYEGELGKLRKVYPIENWNLLGKVRYKKFTVGFDWQHELESNAPSTIPVNYAYVENDVWGQDIRHFYINYNVLNNQKIDVLANITFGDYAINPASNFYIPVDTNGDGLLDHGSPGYKYGYSGYAEGNVKVDWNINERLNIIFGTTYNNVLSFPKTQNLREPYHLDAGFSDNLSNFVDPAGYTFGLLGLTDSIFGERNYCNFATYLQGEYKPVEKWTVTFGGRFDYNSIYKATVNPRVGVVYKVTEKLTLKTLFGSAFIAPSNYYRWENWANPYAMHIPNLNIKPEKMQTFEFSSMYYPSKNLSFRLSAYVNRMKDIIRPVEAPAQVGNYPYYNPMRNLIGENPASGFVEINANLGEIYSEGVEFDLNYQISKVILSVGYSYTNGKDKQTNVNIPKVSEQKVNTSVNYNSKSFFASLSVRYYSDIWTALGNSYYGGTRRIPGAIILYSNLGYRLKDRLVFNLSADNLLNTKHWGAAPYGESIWIQPRAPQALLKVYFGISAKF